MPKNYYWALLFSILVICPNLHKTETYVSLFSIFRPNFDYESKGRRFESCRARHLNQGFWVYGKQICPRITQE